MALVDQGVDHLTEPDLARLNRLLLEAAFPEHIHPLLDKQLFVGWLFWEFKNPQSFTKEFAVDNCLKVFVDFFLGVVGVMLAIIVTASIIPNAFETGAIDLLLSKPIFRVLLYLTKVVGGYAFILLIVSYLIGGVWLISGVRFDYWNHRLLLCIPLMMFLFAIYYSISALAGAIWKNSIICIVMAIVFWAACWTVRAGKHTVFENGILYDSRITSLTTADDELISVNAANKVFRWSAAESQWEDIFSATGVQDFGWGSPIHRPVYDAGNSQLLALRHVYTHYGQPSDTTSLFFGSRDDNWQLHQAPPPPEGSSRIFIRHDGKILIVGTNQVYRLDGTLDPNKSYAQHLEDKSVEMIESNTIESNDNNNNDNNDNNIVYTPIGPHDWDVWSSVAMDRATGALAVYIRGTLRLLKTDAKGDYEVVLSHTVESTADGILAFDGDTLLLGLSDGRVKVFDAATLSERQEFQPHSDDEVIQMEVSPDGRWFAVLFKYKNLWIYDNKQGQPASASIGRQGDISVFAFTKESQLDCAHSFNHVTRLDLADHKIVEQLSPRLESSEWFYWNVLTPIYTIFPKPGELGDMVTYLVTPEKTTANVFGPNEPTTRKLNIWPPIWSNLAFLGVALAIGSLYVYRKDF